MADIIKLNDKKFAKEIRESAAYALRWNDISGGFDLYRQLVELDKKREALDSAVVSVYEDALRDVFFAALPALRENEIANFLARGNLSYILDNEDYDLLEKIKHKLSLIEVVEDRDEFRRLLRESLLRSEEILTDSPLVLEEEKKQGSVKEWLTYYLSAVGGGKTDSVKRSEFLTSRAILTLSEKEKKRVEKLTKLFDFLKLSSLDPEAFENELTADFGDEVWRLEEGKLERINIFQDPLYKKMETWTKALKESSAAAAKNPGELEEKAQKLIKEKFLDPTRAAAAIENIFQPQAKIPPAEEIVAALTVAFQNGNIAKFLERAKPALLRSIESLKDKEPETYERRKTILKEEANLPGALALFLRAILIERLNLPEAQAAAIAGRLIAKLPAKERERYLEIAYYDMEAGVFKWGL